MHARVVGRLRCVVILRVRVCVQCLCARVLVNVIVLGVSCSVVFLVCVGLGGWWHDHDRLCGCGGSGGVRDKRFVYEHGADCEYVEGCWVGLRAAEGARVLVWAGVGVVWVVRCV